MHIYNIIVIFALFLKRIEIMKYKQLIAELTALGCYVVRHGANHTFGSVQKQVVDVQSQDTARRKCRKGRNAASEGF